MYPLSNTMRYTKAQLAILSIVLSSTLSPISNAQQTEPSELTVSPHQTQMSAPQKMLSLTVEESTTAIVGASTLDLNVVITPFKRAKVTHNTNQQFTVDNNKVFFQSDSDKPFSIFITEDDDPRAPQYKLMFVPSNVPVGFQIKLEPDIPYIPKRNQAAQTELPKADGYQTTLSTIATGVAKYLADRKNITHLPEGFRLDDDFESTPYYIGNVLMNPEMRFIGTHYDVYIMNANNRANINLQLSAPDFATLSPTTGVIEDAYDDERARLVGFYPRKVLAPGQSTSIILIHEPRRL